MPTRTRPPIDRTRLVRLTLGLVGLGAVIVLVLALVGGPGEQPPATGAAALVPADALVYVHFSIDPGRPAVKRALSLGSRLPDYPLLSAALQSRIDAILSGSGTANFAQEIRPWLGREAALALLNTTTATAGSLIVLDVHDQAKAKAFVDHLSPSDAGVYRGARLRRYASGSELALVGHYLLLGQDASVRAGIDVAAGASPSLAVDPLYKRASAGEPDGRVVDLYASEAGVRRVLAAQGGLLGALGVLLHQPALAALTVSLSATQNGARVRVHSALDPNLIGLNGSRPTPFTPTLQNTIPSGSILMLDVVGLDRVAPRVLGAAATGGLAGQVGPLLRRLGTALVSQGVNVQDIVSVFHGETAVAIPRNGTKPALLILARTHDEGKTRAALAALELPLEQLFPPAGSGPGQAPLFNDRQVAGVTVHQLSLAPGLQLDYAVSGGLVIISTSLDAVVAVARHGRAVVSDPGYRDTLPDPPRRMTSLLFLDFSQLLSLGEQTGLTRSARYRQVRPDLEKIHAVGLESTSGENDSTAELFLQIK